jgi:hypothetical protein
MPVILVERSSTFERVGELLAAHGYRPCVYDPAVRELAPFDDQPATNVFFLPEPS